MNIKTIVPTVVLSGALLATISLTAGAAPIDPAPARDAALPANSVGTVQVRDNSLGYSDIYGPARTAFLTTYNATVGWPALRPEIREELTKGNVSGVEADAPYPGATQLGDLGENGNQGSNSDAKVPGDSGAASHTVWVKCAPGKVAVGGGFQLAADASLAAKKAIQVVTSQPTGAAIDGDPADSMLPTGWEVEVINNGTEDVIVRPAVTCLAVSAAR